MTKNITAHKQNYEERSRQVSDGMSIGGPQIDVLTVRGLIYSEGKLLVQRRPADASREPNKLQLIGGKVQEGENVLEAISRITLMEAGLDVVPCSAMQCIKRQFHDDLAKIYASTLVTGYIRKEAGVQHECDRWVGGMTPEEIMSNIGKFHSDTPVLMDAAQMMICKVGGLVLLS